MAQLIAADPVFVVPAPCVERHLSRAHGVVHHRIRCIAETVPDPLPLLAADRSGARSLLDIPDDAFVIMMAGTVDWRKGVDLFISLGRMLLPRIPNAYFCWVGAGHMFPLFERSWQTYYNISDELAARFRFTGERKDTVTLLQAADVFTLTSREDPLPLVHIEAAMLQKPIVCFSASGGAPEWIGDAGIVVPFQDTAAMADAVVNLMNDPDRRQKMGEAGRAFMLKHCLPQVTARQMENIIDELCGDGVYGVS
jgi:glycosyltransferase involved in cell wall biosynthesis